MTTLSGTWRPESQQRTYRHVLQASSYPGHVALLDDVEDPAFVAVLATLCDHATSLHDRDSLLSRTHLSYLRASTAEAAAADFILCDAAHEPGEITPRLGALEHPEDGATLVLVGAQVGNGPLVLVLSGPGVDGEARIKLTGVHPAWIQRRNDWNENFPQGVDLILCDRTRVAALPRTTQIRLEV